MPAASKMKPQPEDSINIIMVELSAMLSNEAPKNISSH